MIDISLTLEQKTARVLITAVLLRSEWWPIVKIAQAIRKSEASITRHIGDYAKNSYLANHNKFSIVF
jgi:hypothetical protein